MHFNIDMQLTSTFIYVEKQAVPASGFAPGSSESLLICHLFIIIIIIRFPN